MKRPILFPLVTGFVVAAFCIGRYASVSGKRQSEAQQAHQTTDATDSNGTSASRARDSGARATPTAAPTQAGTGVIINRRQLTADEVNNLAVLYHYLPPPGHYWYDSRSGAWSLEGHETAGFLLPGHEFAPVPADASAGNTGVFINGRELNVIEAMRIQQSLGAVYRGRWWLDGRTGNYGLEGSPMPLGNMIAILRTRQNTRSGDNFWCGVTACGNDNGHSGYVDVGGTIVGYDH